MAMALRYCNSPIVALNTSRLGDVTTFSGLIKGLHCCNSPITAKLGEVTTFSRLSRGFRCCNSPITALNRSKLLVLRAGCGIWLYQFLIIAYLFYFGEVTTLSRLSKDLRCRNLQLLSWISKDLEHLQCVLGKARACVATTLQLQP